MLTNIKGGGIFYIFLSLNEAYKVPLMALNVAITKLIMIY